MVVANVHLPADHPQHDVSMDIKQRQGQLRRILHDLNDPGAIFDCCKKDCVLRLVMGDFNFGDEGDEENRVLREQYRDAWTETHGSMDKEQGWTFDPTRNGVASSLSPGLHGCRCDRILMSTDTTLDDVVRWTDCRVLKAKSFTVDGEVVELNESDHYGVLAELQIQ